jgi:hypothetical protein
MDRHEATIAHSESHQSKASESTWQEISRLANTEVLNPNHIHGHINAPAQPAESPTSHARGGGEHHPAHNSHLPIISFSHAELAELKRDLKKMHEDWNKTEIDGKPLKPGEHIKGSWSAADQKDLPDVTITIGSSAPPRNNLTDVTEKGSTENFTSTNLAKRDQFESTNVDRNAAQTGFEYSTPEAPVDSQAPSSTNVAKRDEFGPVITSGKPSGFEWNTAH